MEREEGWYWVKVCGGWECAKYFGDDYWVITEDMNGYPSNEFDQIGPRITPPEDN